MIYDFNFKTKIPVIVTLFMLSFSCLTYSEDLLSVYQKTKNSSPYVKYYLSERNKAYQKISESRSKLLPQIGLNTDLSYGQGYRADVNKENHQLNGSLTLTQSIFDLSKWKHLDIQEKQAGIADISYQKAQQDIILETATAYFNVLKSIDSLYYINANKKAVYSQLDQATQRFNAGLLSIVDVQNARANYDTILAKEVLARNDLENSIENLKKVSGGNYDNLSTIDTNKFSTIKPDDVNTIISIANKRNLSLLKANLLNDVSLIDVELSESGYLPTVNFNASTGVSNQHFYGRNAIKDPDTGKNRNIYSGENKIEVTVDFPIYSGGETTSKVKQSNYGNQVALENIEKEKRNVTQLSYQSYNNVISSISFISAYKQLVDSSKVSLDSTIAGYNVGTRTIVDVLSATSTLYEAEQKLSNSRYDYIINQLNIAYVKGVLNESDIYNMNKFLGVNVNLKSY